MNKFFIENLNKKEILELLSPYLNAGESGIKYHNMIEEFEPRLELNTEELIRHKYPQGEIIIYLKGGLVFGEEREVGAVGPDIYTQVVAKYHEMYRDMTINNVINNKDE